jgi:hypothetical protein
MESQWPRTGCVLVKASCVPTGWACILLSLSSGLNSVGHPAFHEPQLLLYLVHLLCLVLANWYSGLRVECVS